MTGYNHGVLDVESTRYPFCFDPPDKLIGNPALTPFIPFNHDLNRYLLVVRNAPGRMQVTWGTTRREFNADELAAGINLADAFPENPFSEAFFTAAAAMKQQPDYEDLGIRELLNSLLSWHHEFPGSVEHTGALADMVAAKDLELRAASRAAVKPVSLQLKIEPVK